MSDTGVNVQELAQQLRVDAVRMSGKANSGHPTSSMSAADLMAVLMANHLRYDFADPDNPANDHLIFSKGHASPLLYAVYKAAGAVSEQDLGSYRRFGSMLEGHPTPMIPWVDVATGSLGQGLPIAVGVALGAKRFEGSPSRVWVLCGDSEMAEGSMWEAAEAASFWDLDNLTAIVDVNRLGQSGATRQGWDLDSYRRRFEAFGWHAVTVDGHDCDAVDAAYAEAVGTTGRPTVIVAQTKKGAGVEWVEDQENAHGKAVERWEEAVEALGGDRGMTVAVAKPEGGPQRSVPAGGDGQAELPTYELGDEVATRKAYGQALAALGEVRGDVVALDGEVSNSTYSEIFRAAHPDRYVECYIAEQQMVATAIGLQVRGWTPYLSTFAAFLSRAYDFVRMAAVSRARLCIVGSHAGVSIGEDGPSQMGLEDLASLRAIHGSTVLYPSDATSTAALVAAMADRGGIAYLRTTRGATPTLYRPDESFPIGGSKVVRRSSSDQVALVGAGITLHEAVKAAEALAADGVSARVIDAYSIKPIDAATLRQAARDCDGRIVVAEDHWPEGGLGDAVLEVFAESETPVKVRCLAVSGMPTSGKPAELVSAAGIDAEAIAAAARDLLGGGSQPAADYEPQHVPVNMYETSGALVIVAPLPGVMADDVTVSVEDGTVRIDAAMRTPAEKDYSLHEWHYGPFSRTLEVPEGFRGPAAASFGNGQLAVRLERGDGRPASQTLTISPAD
ncbi:MAG: transketolase [Acidimicrobiia bacterium]